MDLKDIRRKNLANVRKARGYSIKQLADAIMRADNQVSNLLAGRTSFGEKIARSIEESLHLKRYSLDDAAAKFDKANLEENPFNKEIGLNNSKVDVEQITEAIAKAGLTTKQLAERTGMTEKAIQHIMKHGSASHQQITDVMIALQAGTATSSPILPSNKTPQRNNLLQELHILAQTLPTTQVERLIQIARELHEQNRLKLEE